MKQQFNYGSVFEFPPLELADEDGLLAVGGNLSPEQLLYAYSSGIFPWYNDYEPILWWSPDPRFVLYPSELKISKNNKRLFKNAGFEVTYDTAFREVIRQCQQVPRKGQDGTWITEDVLEAYCYLHHIGYAHSVETWKDGKLIGGSYGISMGGCFFGESMFSLVSGASKVAFIHLVKNLEEKGFDMIDCQVFTPYLESFGAKMISRSQFVQELSKSLENETLTGNWTEEMSVKITL